MTISEWIIKHEGKRSIVYYDSRMIPTIGVGRNLYDKGLSDREIYYLLANDITECMADLQTIFPEWTSFTENQKMVLVDLRFQLGSKGFRSFEQTIDLIKKGDWEGVIKHLRASALYAQCRNRVEDNISLLVKTI